MIFFVFPIFRIIVTKFVLWKWIWTAASGEAQSGKSKYVYIESPATRLLSRYKMPSSVGLSIRKQELVHLIKHELAQLTKDIKPLPAVVVTTVEKEVKSDHQAVLHRDNSLAIRQRRVWVLLFSTLCSWSSFILREESIICFSLPYC